MSHNRNLVTRVCSLRGLDGRKHAGAGFDPGIPEAVAGLAPVADICRYGREVDVCEPVTYRYRASEGDDDQRVRAISCHEACYVGFEGAGKGQEVSKDVPLPGKMVFNKG